MMPPNSVSYLDDATIPDDAQLWRNIPPWHVVDDKNSGGKRISKAAFDDHPSGSPMSVALGDEVVAAGRSAASLIEGRDGFCIASITAELARSLQQGIMRKPTHEEPAHAEVFGKKTDGIRRQFARNAVWVVGPQPLATGDDL